MNETKKMFDIIHNNYRQTREQRIAKETRYNKEQAKGEKWCKILSATLIVALLFELTILVIERVN